MTDDTTAHTTNGLRLADLRRDVEAMLFAAGEPLTVDTILEAIGADDGSARRVVEQMLEELAAEFPPEGDRGFELVRLAGGGPFAPIHCPRAL